MEQAIEKIYEALAEDNIEIDERIAELKEAMNAAELKTVELTAERLPLNNRVGRKTLQGYFKKRGVIVTFS